MICAVNELTEWWTGALSAGLHTCSSVRGVGGELDPRLAFCVLTEALLLCGRNEMSVCASVAFTKRDSDGEKGRKDAPASLHSAHFRSGSFVQGDSSEQGEPDRNNTINQTRLSLKSPFPLGRKFASRGHRADVMAANEKEWLTPV